MSKSSVEIYKILRESQNKYTYFILASVAAGIGLSLQQTSGVPMNFSHWVLLLAVILWGLSFYFGCQHISYVNSTLYANMTLLQIEEGEHHELKGELHRSAAKEGIKEAMESNSNVANRFGHWQFLLLIIGALVYIVWHIISMYLAGV